MLMKKGPENVHKKILLSGQNILLGKYMSMSKSSNKRLETVNKIV